MTPREENLIKEAVRFVHDHSFIPDESLNESGETIVSGLALLKLREAVRVWFLVTEPPPAEPTTIVMTKDVFEALKGH